MLRLTSDPLDTLFRPEIPAAPHAVVIGSGFGGPAAAARFGERGYCVTVLEKLDQPGGRARVFRQDGFMFDAGPIIITAPLLFDELGEMCGKKREDHVELRPVDPFYRIGFDTGENFDYSGDSDAMRVNDAAFGLEPTMTQSAWFRPHKASEDIEGLYLVGAETHPGAGLPGVLSSARVLDQVVPHAHALA